MNEQSLHEIYDAIETIEQYGAEVTAIFILAMRLDSRLEKAKNAQAEAKASLRAISKLNKGKNKAIAALCEDD